MAPNEPAQTQRTACQTRIDEEETQVETEATNSGSAIFILQALVPVADGIARMLGPDCEVAIHDLTHPRHSILHIVNGHVTNRKVGDELGPLFGQFLQLTEASQDLLVNYADVEMGRQLRCTKILVRDEKGTAIGCFCINLVIDSYVAAAGVLQQLCETVSLSTTDGSCASEGIEGAEDEEPEEHISSMVRDIIENTIRDVVAPGRRVTRSKRLEIVRFLEERGVFLVKGSVNWAAAKLGVSRFTVYGDLEQVRSGTTEDATT
jgi:predicted transcriptional regulator YheO